MIRRIVFSPIALHSIPPIPLLRYPHRIHYPPCFPRPISQHKAGVPRITSLTHLRHSYSLFIAQPYLTSSRHLRLLAVLMNSTLPAVAQPTLRASKCSIALLSLFRDSRRFYIHVFCTILYHHPSTSAASLAFLFIHHASSCRICYRSRSGLPVDCFWV